MLVIVLLRPHSVLCHAIISDFGHVTAIGADFLLHSISRVHCSPLV